MSSNFSLVTKLVPLETKLIWLSVLLEQKRKWIGAYLLMFGSSIRSRLTLLEI